MLVKTDRNVLQPVRGRAGAQVRVGRSSNNSATYCSFCKKNGELETFYRSHKLRDENHRVQCPVLLRYTCPCCNATGEHTMSYCPKRLSKQTKKVSLLALETAQLVAASPARFNAQSPKGAKARQVKSSQVEGELISVASENEHRRLRARAECAWQLPDHGVPGGTIMLEQLLIASATVDPDQRAYFISCMGYSLLRLDLINQMASVAEDIINRELVAH